MSEFNQNDLAALDRDIQGFPPQEKQRGWWSRNWLWFVPTLLLTLIILCCGCPVGIGVWFLNQVYNLDVYKMSMQRIEADEGLRKELGQPITTVAWPPPSFRVEQQNDRGEADIRWDLEGPKGRAKAHVTARLAADKWELVVLEVVLPSGKKVSLMKEGEGGDDAPPFGEGPKPNATPIKNNKPAPEINMPIPGDIPEATEKP